MLPTTGQADDHDQLSELQGTAPAIVSACPDWAPVWHGGGLAGVRRSGATLVPQPLFGRFHPACPPSGDAASTPGSYRPRRTSPQRKDEPSWLPARTSPHGDDSVTGTSSPRTGCSTARESSRTTRSRSGVIGSRPWHQPRSEERRVGKSVDLSGRR